MTSLPSSLGNSPAEKNGMSAKCEAAQYGKEPTSELIVRDIEDSQIDKFAELLRQCCAEAAVGHRELLEVRESAPFRRNSTSKLVRSFVAINSRDATRQIKNLKRNWKHLWQRACANKTPNSLATIKPLSMDAEQLTFESARDYLERLEICQSAPFGRDSTSKLVGVPAVFAKSEHLE